MPGFQTKALVVTSISGENFRIISPNCMVSQACVLRQSRFVLFIKEDRFLMLFQTCTKLTFGLSDILVITVIARNRIKSVGQLFICDRILRFGKNMPQSLKRFLTNFNVVAINNSLDGSRNTLTVRSNCKTSRLFLLIKTITSNFIHSIFKSE